MLATWNRTTGSLIAKKWANEAAGAIWNMGPRPLSAQARVGIGGGRGDEIQVAGSPSFSNPWPACNGSPASQR